MKRLCQFACAVVAVFLLLIQPSWAQWQTPNHSVPIGQGAGVTGFGNAPAIVGGLLQSTTTGADPAFTRTPVLGASGTLGTLGFGNATTGTVTLQPVTGALGSAVLSLPAITDTIVGLASSQALTNKTYNGNTWTAGTGTLTIATGKTFTANNNITVSGTDGKTLALTNGLTVTTNDGTLAFGAASKTLTVNKSLTLDGTDSTTMTFPSVSATITRTVASGTKALATGAISSATCTSAQTSTATGTLTTDAIIVSFNADPTGVTGYVPLTTGMLTIIPYPTADTVNFKICNNTTASITPGAITLNWAVHR